MIWSRLSACAASRLLISTAAPGRRLLQFEQDQGRSDVFGRRLHDVERGKGQDDCHPKREFARVGVAPAESRLLMSLDACNPRLKPCCRSSRLKSDGYVARFMSPTHQTS